MNKFSSGLSALILSVCLIAPAYAEDIIKVDAAPDENLANENIDIFIEAPEPGRAKGLTEITDSDTFISDSSNIVMPECDNVRLHALVLKKIEDYFSIEHASSVIEKRNQILLLRNFNKYEMLDTNNFSTKENTTVADKIITYKINKGLDNDKIRICRSYSERPIYLFIYPTGNSFIAEIVNFPGQPHSERFSVVYE